MNLCEKTSLQPPFCYLFSIQTTHGKHSNQFSSSRFTLCLSQVKNKKKKSEFNLHENENNFIKLRAVSLLLENPW